jgi:hypothetical protein
LGKELAAPDVELEAWRSILQVDLAIGGLTFQIDVDRVV